MNITKERPILFSTPMIQALLSGTKTQTRRIITARNSEMISLLMNLEAGIDLERCKTELININCPYGKVGDIVWVRETFWKGETWLESDEKNTRRESVLYKADTNDPRPCDVSESWCINEYGFDKSLWPSWKPSIHMPKDAARIWLRIKDVRVERVQDISEDDAKAEGVVQIPSAYAADRTGYRKYPHKSIWTDSARSSFCSLWQSINGEESWDANPWIWVVEFQVLSTSGKPESISTNA